MDNHQPEHYTKISIKEFLILRLLAEREEMYGLEMVEASAGELKRGTVYPTLQRMSEKEYVESSEEPRVLPEIGTARRMYRITDFGRRVLDKNAALSDLLIGELLDLDRAAELMFVSVGKLEEWIESGEIDFVEGVDGEIRISIATLLSEETKSYFEKGSRWEAMSGWEEAIAHGEHWLNKAIESNSRYGHAIHEMGRMYFTFWRYREAVKWLERSVELNPDAFQPSMNLGMNYRLMQRYADAEICFRNVIRVNPTFAKAYHELGLVLYMQGLSHPREKLWDALEVLKAAFKMEPSYQSAYSIRTLLAASYLDTYNQQEALLFAEEIKPVYADIAEQIWRMLGIDESAVA